MKKGAISEGTDSGMAEVMQWLYNDGRSSVLSGGQDMPAQEDNMSLGSLQAASSLALASTPTPTPDTNPTPISNLTFAMRSAT